MWREKIKGKPKESRKPKISMEEKPLWWHPHSRVGHGYYSQAHILLQCKKAMSRVSVLCVSTGQILASVSWTILRSCYLPFKCTWDRIFYGPNVPRMQRITVSPSQSPARLVTAVCPGGSGLYAFPSGFLWSGPSLAMSRLFFLGCFPLPETLLCASFCLCTPEYGSSFRKIHLVYPLCGLPLPKRESPRVIP